MKTNARANNNNINKNNNNTTTRTTQKCARTASPQKHRKHVPTAVCVLLAKRRRAHNYTHM